MEERCDTRKRSRRGLLLRALVGLGVGAAIGVLLSLTCLTGTCPLTSSPVAAGAVFGLVGLFFGLGGCCG